MRSVSISIVILATVCALVVAAGDAPKIADRQRAAEEHTKLRTRRLAMKSLGSMFSNATGQIAEYQAQMKANMHHFRTQQALPAPASDDPICQTAEYTTLLLSLYTECVSLGALPVGNTYDTDASATAAWDSFCAATCVSSLQANAIGTQYWICLDKSTQWFAEFSVFGCNRVAGERCGVTLDRIPRAFACENRRSRTSCNAASATCQWEVSTNSNGFESGECNPILSNTLLDGVCSTCLDNYNSGLGRTYSRNQFSIALRGAKDFVCIRDSNNGYCWVSVSNAIDSISSTGLTNATVGALCGNSNERGCFKRVMTASVGMIQSQARAQFLRCAMLYGNVTSSVNRYCMPTFTQTMASAESSAYIASSLCVQNARGDYCMSYVIPVVGNPCYWYADFGFCTTACTQNLTGTVTAMGCCTGTIHEFVNVITRINIADAPPVNGAQPTLPPSPTAPPTTSPVVLADNEELIENPVGGGLHALSTCSVPGMAETLRKRCRLVRYTVQRALSLRLVWSAINADPALKASIKASIEADTAAPLGVSPRDLNGTLSEDPTIQVAVATTNRRQGGTASGTRYTFTAAAETPEDAQRVGSDFDAKLGEGGINMQQTIATLEASGCSSCTGTEGSSAVNQQTVVGGGSGSGMVATMAAIVVATIAILL